MRVTSRWGTPLRASSIASASSCSLRLTDSMSTTASVSATTSVLRSSDMPAILSPCRPLPDRASAAGGGEAALEQRLGRVRAVAHHGEADLDHLGVVGRQLGV